MSATMTVSEISPTEKSRVFVHLRHVDGRTHLEGRPNCLLGHKLLRGTGDVSDGVFAEWNWDGKTLTASTDRYGFYLLFYFHRANEICIAASVPLLLTKGANPDLDFEALSIFFRLGFFLSNDTAFKHIRVLPPGGSLVWAGDTLRVDGDIEVRALCELDPESAIERYRELFTAAIERRLVQEASCLPLSGGRDSRHILFELQRQRRGPAFCATMRYPPPYSSEDQVAERVCRAVGTQHIAFEAKFTAPVYEEVKNALTNFSTFEHRWILELADHLRGKQQFLYDGVAGDVLSAGHFLTEERLRFYRTGNLEGLADHLLAPDVLSKLLDRSVAERLRQEAVRTRLVQELQRHVAAPNPVGSFFFWNRTRRVAAVGPFAILESVGSVFAPFLDHDLWDFLSSLPAELFLDHTFHTKVIEISYPEFAGIPYANKTKVAVDNFELRRQAFGLLRHLNANKGKLIKKSAYIARLLRSIADPGYYLDMGLENAFIYLSQIGAV